MEITIPAVKEEAEKWVCENLSRFVITTFRDDNVATVSLDERFQKEFRFHMSEWAKDVKLVAREG